ncbi:MAG: hypothetical protein L0Z62_49320 [Gemmataceae bacterium]|nr:hypothetical protein [Gemmataceae bacterium]
MSRQLSALFVIAVALGSAGTVAAAPTRTFEAELKVLLDQVADALDKDVALKGRTASLGRIASEDRPDSNYAPELRRLFEGRLKGKLVPDGFLKITVDYDLVDSEKDVAEGHAAGKMMKVLLIRVVIKDDKKRELFNKSVEINESADIARVMGLTVAPPPRGNQAQRNDEIHRTHRQNHGKPADQVKPAFQVKNSTQVGIVGDHKFFVEILVKDRPEGPVRPIQPVPNAVGNAFVDVEPHQFYEIVVHNCDVHDCVAQIRIDGQDAMNRFNGDGVHYPGLLIAKGSAGVLRGWMHTVKPRPKEKDNVFSFAVREYAHGSAASVPATGEVGVITVQFAVAWKEGEARPSGRTIGRITDKGPGLQQDFRVERRHIGEFNETISIRYSPTAR